MKIVALKQNQAGETRTPLIPGSIRKLTKLGAEVLVEAGLGAAAGQRDADYEAENAKVLQEAELNQALAEADVVLTIHPPAPERIEKLRQGAVLVGALTPLKHQERVQALKAQGVSVFSMEFIPRISRAQAMDVLSSQANLGGYMAVILAASHCPKIFPMMMTAAGNIAPARVFVLGAGVAGLQAIATAKRLGAVVEAFDVRKETKEQVQSLNARFVELPTDQQEGTAAGGYAKEQSEEQRKKQQELMAKHVTGADAVITTAAVFGKAPPELVPQEMVDGMKPGSVLVDMAADPDAGRGNCSATKPGEVYTTDRGVTIVGTLNLPALVPVHASQVYSANMVNFVVELIDKESKALKLDLEDNLQKGALIAHGGGITNEILRKAYGEPEPEPQPEQAEKPAPEQPSQAEAPSAEQASGEQTQAESSESMPLTEEATSSDASQPEPPQHEESDESDNPPPQNPPQNPAT
jgi:NAD(P) transhydrogenase subunit alpha